MFRVFFTIVLPLVLPTALYLVWIQLAHWSSGGSSPGSQEESERGAAVRWAALPWVWLAAAGAVLLALVLFVVTVHFGNPQPGTYVPPRWENGRIVPGHIEPAHKP
jgi:uncharacterized protein DUF6111